MKGRIGKSTISMLNFLSFITKLWLRDRISLFLGNIHDSINALKKKMMYGSYFHMDQKNKQMHTYLHVYVCVCMVVFVCVCVCVCVERDKCGTILKMENLGKDT